MQNAPVLPGRFVWDPADLGQMSLANPSARPM